MSVAGERDPVTKGRGSLVGMGSFPRGEKFSESWLSLAAHIASWVKNGRQAEEQPGKATASFISRGGE